MTAVERPISPILHLYRVTNASVLSGELPVSPLFRSVVDKDLDACRKLLLQGASMGEVGPIGMTAFQRAVCESAIEFVKLMLSHGVNINAPEQPRSSSMPLIGSTPLDRACANQDHDMIEFLIGAGADVNAKMERGRTALSTAVQRSDPRACDQLLAAGADIESVYQGGGTVLLEAVSANNAKMVDFLLARGANPSFVPDNAAASYLTPLQYAVFREHVWMVPALAGAAGADLAQRTLKGRTLMRLAGKNEEIKALLRSAKTAAAVADVVATRDAQGQSAPAPCSAKPSGAGGCAL
jgi:ankyrin repeat protein